MRSSILNLSFYLSLGSVIDFDNSDALFRKLDATDMDDDYFDNNTI